MLEGVALPEQVSVVIVSGSPRLPIDSIRFMQVAVSGRTGAVLADQLQAAAVDTLAVVANDAAAAVREVLPASSVITWITRDDLDAALQLILQRFPEVTIVLTAAINDYDVDALTWTDKQGKLQTTPAGPDAGKVPSGATDVQIRLQPAASLSAICLIGGTVVVWLPVSTRQRRRWFNRRKICSNAIRLISCWRMRLMGRFRL